jgi:hypothetical protein
MLIPISPWLTINAGHPVRATSLLTDPTAAIVSHALVFQQCPGNTGVLYVFTVADGDKTGTLTGTSGMISAVSYNTDGVAIILPHLVFSIPGTGDCENAANYWVDGSHTGDKVAVSRLVW